MRSGSVNLVALVQFSRQWEVYCFEILQKIISQHTKTWEDTFLEILSLRLTNNSWQSDN